MGTPPDRVFVVRHAEAGDRSRWTGDDRERPLTKHGWRQAGGLVGLLEGETVAAVLASPYVRCRQTVEPLAAARGLPVEDARELEEGRGAARALGLIGTLHDAVLCTHGDILQDLLEWLRGRGVTVDGGQAKGSTWVLDVVCGEVVGALYLPSPA